MAKNIIMWVLAAFMGLSCIGFFPSIASIIMLIFAVIAAPIAPWQEFLSGFGLRGWMKGLVLCAAFIGAVMVLPQSDTADVPTPSEQPSYRGTLPSKKPDQTESHAPNREIPVTSEQEPTEEPSPTPVPTVNPTPTPTPVSTSTPTPTPKPTPEPTQAPTTQPTPEPQPIRGRAPNTVVYVSNRSNTIHSVHDCSGMRNYREMTIYNATQRGYEFCPNCW